MLEGLDTIPWAKLSHAFGKATDVPRLLRALGGARAKAADKALDALHGNIWHQGTVYPATPHAVPFLVELALCHGTHQREQILSLLQLIAEGRGYLAVHDPGARGVKTEAAHVIQSREAVARHLPDFLTLLDDERVEVRRQMPALLCALPGGKQWILEHAERQLGEEPDLICAINWIFAISRCCAGDSTWAERLPLDASAAPALRLAVAHVRLAAGAAPRAGEAARLIISALLQPEDYADYLEEIFFFDADFAGGLEGLFLGLLRTLPHASLRWLVEPASELAPQLDDFSAEMVCAPLLPVVFPTGVPASGTALTREQRIIAQQAARAMGRYHGDPHPMLERLQETGILAEIEGSLDASRQRDG